MIFAEVANQGVYKLSAEERATRGIVYSEGTPGATSVLKRCDPQSVPLIDVVDDERAKKFSKPFLVEGLE